MLLMGNAVIDHVREDVIISILDLKGLGMAGELKMYNAKRVVVELEFTNKRKRG